MVGLGRVELPAYGLGNRRSIHLSYSPTTTDYYIFTAMALRESQKRISSRMKYINPKEKTTPLENRIRLGTEVQESIGRQPTLPKPYQF